jgi:flagellar hook-associated protein FlgK
VHREDLAGLNRSIQSTAKGIKTQLEGLSKERAALPEPQQAKLRKLMQDFAAALQVMAVAFRGSAGQVHRLRSAAAAAAARTALACTRQR